MIAELSKRRVFRVISGYAVVCFVILQIADVAFEPLGIGDGVLRIVIAGMLLALPLVAYLSWIFDVDPESSLQRTKSGRPWLEATITLVALVGLAIGAWFVLRPVAPEIEIQEAQALAAGETLAQPDATAEQSIVVLPFTNLSSDPEQEFFSDGMTEDILNLLALHTSLSVRPRSSAFALKGVNLDLQEIGQRLNVTHALTGSVRRSGERIRVTVELSEVESNRSIWSDRYEGNLTDIFAFQDEISESVVGALNKQFVQRSVPRRFVSEEAYKAYVLGHNHMSRFEFTEAIRWLTLAAELDPSNPDIWGDLARINGITPFFSPYNADVRQNMNRYIERTLAIDPAHPNALGVRALWDFIVERDYQRSINELARLAKANPNNTEVHLYLSYVLGSIRRDDLAIRVAAHAAELDPLSPGELGGHVKRLLFSEAVEEARLVLDEYLDKIPAIGVLATVAVDVAIAEGNVDSMQVALENTLLASTSMNTMRAAMVPHFLGNQAAVREVLAPLNDANDSYWIQSHVAIMEGRFDTAIGHWRQGILAGEPYAILYMTGQFAWRKAFPEFYKSPAYQQMLVEFRFDEASRSKITVPELRF